MFTNGVIGTTEAAGTAHSAQSLGAFPITWHLISRLWKNDVRRITMSLFNYHFIVDFMKDGLVQRRVDSTGGSHANVTLIAPFANCDDFKLSAMCSSHENQAG